MAEELILAGFWKWIFPGKFQLDFQLPHECFSTQGTPKEEKGILFCFESSRLFECNPDQFPGPGGATTPRRSSPSHASAHGTKQHFLCVTVTVWNVSDAEWLSSCGPYQSPSGYNCTQAVLLCCPVQGQEERLSVPHLPTHIAKCDGL